MLPLRPILRVRLFLSLPLHVARIISPTLAQRNKVVDDIAWPFVRVAGLELESVLRGLAPLDPAMLVAQDARCVAASVLRGSGIVVRRIVVRWRAGV